MGQRATILYWEITIHKRKTPEKSGVYIKMEVSGFEPESSNLSLLFLHA